MKILEKEIALREETRATEQAKPQMKAGDFEDEAISLAATQDELAERTEIVIEKIHELPDGAQQFGKEIQQLTGAVNAMWDASDILGESNTGFRLHLIPCRFEHFTRHGIIYPFVPLLAEAMGAGPSAIGFTVGAFSLIAVFLSVPLAPCQSYCLQIYCW